MGCVLLPCKYGAQLLLTQKIGCGSGNSTAAAFVFRVLDWGPLLLQAGLPSRKAGLRVISSGGSLPTPPDFYCPMAETPTAWTQGRVNSEEVRVNKFFFPRPWAFHLFTIHSYLLSLI